MFDIGSIVYHITDEVQEPRVVTGIVHRPNNILTYLVSNKDGESECYEVEISKEKTVH
ncbi:hypothetical protein [Aquimarina sp. 2201CG5-10]|uniref:hypothetical protein n=1 Tax=Aquimarina callyspongiae TaxID=3098150 RepID=UPI002AB5AF56|nr:hypothetical protein [Aquimarina sp. 2201CG5-10]MDY8137572.1 hypothetical protein [Aquimarina sp. 2201CG5-10]